MSVVFFGFIRFRVLARSRDGDTSAVREKNSLVIRASSIFTLEMDTDELGNECED